MQNISLEIVTDIEQKREAMIQCDAAYTESIVARPDFESYLDKLHRFGTFLVAKDEENILGYAIMYANDIDSKEAYLTLICIKSEFQGQGVGSLMIKKCYEEALAAGMNTMRLAVLKVDQAQRGFYEKQGFSIVGGTEDRYSMLKQL